jgi:hypothetical protein
MDHVWSVLCLKASIDRETNNISLFDVLEQVRVLPPLEREAIIGPFELVSLWTRSAGHPERGQARVTLRGPSGSLQFQQTQEIDLREYRRMRARLRVSVIPIEGAGTYHFSVEVPQVSTEDWAEIAEIPLDVEVLATGPQPRS